MTTAAAAEEIRPGVFRTPDERFQNLPDFDFEPHYAEVDGYRIHYLDEGPAEAAPIVLIHGEPTWSYLYRHMIPVLAAAGHRCIVPDLIGFGRSDKPAQTDTHTYAFHVAAITGLVEALDLRDATFFGQDWGGLIGLRVVAENEQRFARVVVANTGLPTGEGQISSAFMAWRRMVEGFVAAGDMDIGALLANNIGPEVRVAYEAPFPDKRYKAGPIIMPLRVPISGDDPAAEANKRAWQVFSQWQKPFLTAFSDGDPVTRGGEAAFQQRIPGAQGRDHPTIEGAGHFLQETHGEELAEIIAGFIADRRGRDAP